MNSLLKIFRLANTSIAGTQTIAPKDSPTRMGSFYNEKSIKNHRIIIMGANII